jgi:DNA-binding response OmpR family regulator
MPNLASPSTLRLLVVDDDEPIRLLMNAVFRGRDVDIDCVGDGSAALAMLRREHYDAVILDLMLPGTNGFEVIRELKSLAPEMLRRTIVLTAVSSSTLRDFDDARLLRRLMRKPFDLDELVGEVLSCRLSAPVEQHTH